MIKAFFGSHTKKGLHMSHGEEKGQIQTYFNSQSHSSHNENKGVEISMPKFARFFPYFQRFCPDFWQIKTFRVALVSPAYPPATPLSKLPARSSTETQSLLLYGTGVFRNAVQGR